jgi:Xaa-Pro dipeptidase
VQNLDGWLLADHGGMNPVARSLVDATGAPSRRWFYLVPRQGEPTLVVHASEVASFAAVPGKRVVYTGYRDLDPILKKLLKGKKTLAMEYSPRGALPSLSRVDAGTIELVRAAGVTVKSSDALVQFSKASWGLEGRKAHYLARTITLTELRKDALALLARAARGQRQPVTEREVADRIVRGMATRGLSARRRWSRSARTPPIRPTPAGHRLGDPGARRSRVDPASPARSTAASTPRPPGSPSPTRSSRRGSPSCSPPPPARATR